MKKVLALLVSLILCIGLLFGCGSNNFSSGSKSNIDFGSSYQTCYDFAEENSVDGEINYEESSGIWTDMKWFGDEDIYTVWLGVKKTGDEGLEDIHVRGEAPIDTDVDPYNEKGARIVSALKEQFGDPVGENVDNVSPYSEDVVWKTDKMDITLTCEDGFESDYDYWIWYRPIQ